MLLLRKSHYRSVAALALFAAILCLFVIPTTVASDDSDLKSRLQLKVNRLKEESQVLAQAAKDFEEELRSSQPKRRRSRSETREFRQNLEVVKALESRSRLLKNLVSIVESRMEGATEAELENYNAGLDRVFTKIDEMPELAKQDVFEREYEKARLKATSPSPAAGLGDIEYQAEIRNKELAEEREKEKQAELEKARAASIAFGDMEYEFEKRNRELAQKREAEAEEERERARKASEAFGDLEHQWTLSLQKQKDQEEEKYQREREASHALADLENQWDESLRRQEARRQEIKQEKKAEEEAEDVQEEVSEAKEEEEDVQSSELGEVKEEEETPRVVASTSYAPETSPRPRARPREISDILIEPLEDFYLLPNKRNARQRLIRTTNRDVNVRVIGQRNGMYRVKLYENGEEEPGSFFIDKKWAHKTLNFTAALSAIDALQNAQTAGAPPNQTCEPEVEGDDPIDVQEITEIVKPERVIASGDDFKPGCEVLASELSNASSEQLNQCLHSIKHAIANGARNRSGTLNREKLYCNMYKNLRPEEQHFAGMVFTSVGEAGIVSTTRGTPAPKFQEQLFVMKTMDNRLRQARSDKGNHLNALDMALAHKQFSMYNRSIFPSFRKVFEPQSRAHELAEGHAIDAFINYQSNSHKLTPAEDVDNIGMYFNPHGMTKLSSLPASSRARARSKVRYLVSQGKLPRDYPSDRIAPAWDFDKIDMVPDLAYDGAKVRKARPYMHVFYKDKRGRPYYGNKNNVPPKWRSQCAQ